MRHLQEHRWAPNPHFVECRENAQFRPYPWSVRHSMAWSLTLSHWASRRTSSCFLAVFSRASRCVVTKLTWPETVKTTADAMWFSDP